jgi:hypothetical protein
MKYKYLLLLALSTPALVFAKGINVTKDKFISGFCEYLSSPDINTESNLCPINVVADESSGGTGYSFDLPNGSSVSFRADEKSKKVTDVYFSHSTDIAESDDVMQTKYAIIYAADRSLQKKHGEDYYTLISARKAMRAGMKTPVEHNTLTHNGIDYMYTYDSLGDDFSFQLHNQ